MPVASPNREVTQVPCYTAPFASRGLEVANLTLSIDDELLQKAREAAVREQTSVNSVVREFLIRYVNARSRQFEALDALDKVAKRNVSRSSGNWTRDSLHER